MATNTQPTTTQPTTLGDLRESGYKVVSVREEMRNNLVRCMKQGKAMFEGIVGFEETVIPQLENAILAGQDIILLGERGQAKTRLLRALVSLLDEQIPTIAGSEINDNPFDPISKASRDYVAEVGDDTPITWIGRDSRYSEKLATPDISIADLIGEVDPIKVAEGRYLADELAIHYGLVPRTNRGIFAINELPDLAERIQVGLFNLMEERDVQIKGYRVRLPLDIMLVATANPEDYTNRGRIITPLKDRYGAQIRTHYPRTIEHEMDIMEQERARFPNETSVCVPDYMREVIAELTSLARRSSDINQRSGVSVRVSIANYETLISNAMRRSIRSGEEGVSPRITDLPFLVASFSGKVELETFEEGREARIMEDLAKRAVLNVFNRRFNADDLEELVYHFEGGAAVEASSTLPSAHYAGLAELIPSLKDAVEVLGSGDSPEGMASAMEFVLEGLHLNRRLNCDRTDSGLRYGPRG